MPTKSDDVRRPSPKAGNSEKEQHPCPFGQRMKRTAASLKINRWNFTGGPKPGYNSRITTVPRIIPVPTKTTIPIITTVPAVFGGAPGNNGETPRREASKETCRYIL